MDTKAANIQAFYDELEREIQYKQSIRRNTRMCPGCDTEQFIPYDDYICKECRNEGL